MLEIEEELSTKGPSHKKYLFSNYKISLNRWSHVSLSDIPCGCIENNIESDPMLTWEKSKNMGPMCF